MNKKLMSILSTGLMYFSLYGMQSEDKPTKYLTHSQEYKRFKEKRIIQRSNFGCLPEEIVNHIRSHLVYAVSTHFKHRLLNHKWQECYSEPIPSPINSLIVDRWKPFIYHDGTYTMVPDMAEYAMWDGDTNKYEDFAFGDNRQNFYDTITILRHADAQSIFRVCCPSQEGKLLESKNTLYVLGREIFSKLICSGLMVSCLLSADGKSFMLGYDDAIQFFNIPKHKLAEKYKFGSSTIAFCAAHHSSLFAICTQERLFSLVTPEKIIAKVISSLIKSTFTSIQFSPNDHYLCMNNDRNIIMWDVSNADGFSFRCRDFATSDDIRKVFFSPDSTRILVALKNGRLYCGSNFFKKPTLELCDYVDLAVTWRYKDVVDVDTQTPRILWGNKDELLFSLDPSNHNDRTIFNFVIRDSNTGRFLSACNFYPNNPIAMGLTKDEGSVIFVHKDQQQVSRFDLYTDNTDICNADIDFIEHKASLYELCCLWQQCKKIKIDQIDGINDKNAKSLVKKIRSLIQSFR